jgi:hypothetical protein
MQILVNLHRIVVDLHKILQIIVNLHRLFSISMSSRALIITTLSTSIGTLSFSSSTLFTKHWFGEQILRTIRLTSCTPRIYKATNSRTRRCIFICRSNKIIVARLELKEQIQCSYEVRGEGAVSTREAAFRLTLAGWSRAREQSGEWMGGRCGRTVGERIYSSINWLPLYQGPVSSKVGCLQHINWYLDLLSFTVQ